MVFIAADHRECGPWVGRWDALTKPELPVHWVRAGKWQGRDVIAIANGAGQERARAAVGVVEALEPSAFVSIGTCGALDSSLQIGDVFVPTEIRGGGRKWIPAQLVGPGSKHGPLISVARIAATASEKSQLRTTGALVVEMESAGVADASERLGVPFYCVRSVSDLAGQDFANDFNKEVFALPGRSNDAYSKGCNNLIRQQKAHLITSAEELCSLMDWKIESKPSQLLMPELNIEETKIFNLLRREHSLDLDVLKWKFEGENLALHLLKLELKGVVRCLPGNKIELT